MFYDVIQGQYSIKTVKRLLTGKNFGEHFGIFHEIRNISAPISQIYITLTIFFRQKSQHFNSLGWDVGVFVRRKFRMIIYLSEVGGCLYFEFLRQYYIIFKISTDIRRCCIDTIFSLNDVIKTLSRCHNDVNEIF